VPVPGDAGGAEGAGDPEIHHLHHAAGREHQVRALHVAMHDAVLVGVADPRERLCEQRERPRHRQASLALQQPGEGLAGHELHHHELPTLGLEQRVERGDVRVVEPGEGARLRAKAGQQLRLRREVGPQRLHGDGPAEQEVGGLEDLADSTLADSPQDPVVADRVADQRAHLGRPPRAGRLRTRYRTSPGAS
jgi:hypothetical protein